MASTEIERVRCTTCGVKMKGRPDQVARLKACPRCGASHDAIQSLNGSNTLLTEKHQVQQQPTLPRPRRPVRISQRGEAHRVQISAVNIPPRSKSKYKAEPWFVGPGQSVVAFGNELKEPLIYVSDSKRYGGFDASLICLRREIDPPRSEPPKSLGYWPQLSEVKPYQLGIYMHWLAEGRGDPDVDIGYVFLYFYGLERRALVDGVDTIAIAREVLRLLDIYQSNGSFREYATNLLAHLVLIRLLKPTKKIIARLISFQGKRLSEQLWSLILGYHAKEQVPLPADIAMVFAQQDELAKRSVVSERVPEELSRLFEKKYLAAFPGGITPNATGNEAKIRYHGASPTLSWQANERQQVPVAMWPSVKRWRSE